MNRLNKFLLNNIITILLVVGIAYFFGWEEWLNVLGIVIIILIPAVLNFYIIYGIFRLKINFRSNEAGRFWLYFLLGYSLVLLLLLLMDGTAILLIYSLIINAILTFLYLSYFIIENFILKRK